MLNTVKCPKCGQEVEISDFVRRRLEEGLVSVFYGRHDSSEVHKQVIEEREKEGSEAPILQALRTLPEKARKSLLNEDLRALGEVMQESTAIQNDLADGIVSKRAKSIIRVASHQKGFLGAKINGAGGNGGSVTVLFDDRGQAEEFHQECLTIYPAGSQTYFEHKLADK